MDDLIRLAAFKWLTERSMHFDEVFPREILSNGFYFNNQRISLVGPKGIWKPQACRYPISITTTSDSPYEDKFTEDNFLNYKYRGTDPLHPDNVGVRELYRNNLPLIYFHGIVKGKYLASYPIYIIADDIRNLSFTAALEDSRMISSSLVNEDSADYYRRSYLTSNVKTRLHQRSFRERVLMAYRNQCAFCRLKHIELLDAAHITPDTSFSGEPIVQNGLSLCKIHHAAYDKHILGITPDYIIKVRHDILEETDGPMLKYGLQYLQNKVIELPKNVRDYPDKTRLDERYTLFKSA